MKRKPGAEEKKKAERAELSNAKKMRFQEGVRITRRAGLKYCAQSFTWRTMNACYHIEALRKESSAVQCHRLLQCHLLIRRQTVFLQK